MISVYNDEDLLSVYKQKQKIFWIFVAITAFYLAFCIAWLIYHISLPYGDAKDVLPQAMVYIASVLYVLFIMPYMAIKYSRVRRYYKMLTYVGEGLKTEETNYFYRFREKSLQKDNIDVIGCVFETWSRKKSEWLEREAYFDPEKKLPDFESGDYVRYVSQSNFIIQYEILQRKALEFEEEEEETEEEVVTTQDEQTPDQETVATQDEQTPDQETVATQDEI